MRRAGTRSRRRRPQCPECGSFRTDPDGLMDAIANAASRAADAPRDIGRPLSYYVCRNCWHTFTICGSGQSGTNATHGTASDGQPNGTLLSDRPD